MSTEDRHVHAFGSAVRYHRTKLGLSQEALAFKAGIHRTYVSDVERGARNPTVRVIWRLSDALQVRPSQVFARAEQLLTEGD